MRCISFELGYDTTMVTGAGDGLADGAVVAAVVGVAVGPGGVPRDVGWALGLAVGWIVAVDVGIDDGVPDGAVTGSVAEGLALSAGAVSGVPLGKDVPPPPPPLHAFAAINVTTPKMSLPSRLAEYLREGRIRIRSSSVRWVRMAMPRCESRRNVPQIK